MTDAELQVEHDYRLQERLGMLCEDRNPTREEEELARKGVALEIAKLKSETI